eukprot:g8586.t1
MEGETGSTGGSAATRRIILGLLILLVLLHVVLMWRVYAASVRSHRHDNRPVKPPTAGIQTSLVITDIQDSTTLWETIDADEMDEALQLHNACLRQILRQNRGYESATEGDAFILAFHTAIDAVRFCIEAQLALLEVQWPDAIIPSSVSPPVALNEHTNNLRTVIDRFSNGYQPDQNTSTQDLSPDSTGFTIDNNAVFWETAETQQSTEGATGVLPSLRFLFK